MKGLFVTGTDTDVGKTWVGSRLVSALIESNIAVKARKPIESGWPSVEDISSTDAWMLANATGDLSAINEICPNRFAAALSPDRAAALEGKTIVLDKLRQDCLRGTEASDFLYVEGAGGFYSPISSDGLNADLAHLLKLPVLLVVEDRLGCINQTLLNIEAIEKQGLKLCAIVLNKSNADYLADMNNLTDIQKRVDHRVLAFSHNEASKDSMKELVGLVLNQD